MERYTPVERYFLAQLMDTYGSVTMVQREFAKRFGLKPRDSRPSSATIRRAQANAHSLGLATLPKSGRDRDARTEENVSRVLQSIEENPQTSQRRLSNHHNLSQPTINRILKEAKFHPYRLRVVHSMNEEDYENRVDFANEMLSQLDRDRNFFKRILFSDEATFHTCGGVNKWNTRYYSHSDPNFTIEKPLHSPKFCVWVGVTWDRVFGPYFFTDDKGAYTNVDGLGYRRMLENWLYPQLQGFEPFEEGSLFFQQDGATPHTSKIACDYLRQIFPGKLISRRGDINWPARSPDLTPLDYWLWGDVKSKVYTAPIASLSELRTRIEEEIGRISAATRQNAIGGFGSRLQLLLEVAGKHIE